MHQRDLKLLATALSRHRACTYTYALGLFMNILNARVIKRYPVTSRFRSSPDSTPKRQIYSYVIAS